MVRTIDIMKGEPLPDVSHYDASSALARKREVEANLPATRNDPSRGEERRRLVAENDALSKHLAELREAEKRERTRRNFAGLESPRYEAIVARLPADVVRELEHDAMLRFADRERKAAERKAKQGK